MQSTYMQVRLFYIFYFRILGNLTARYTSFWQKEYIYMYAQGQLQVCRLFSEITLPPTSILTKLLTFYLHYITYIKHYIYNISEI